MKDQSTLKMAFKFHSHIELEDKAAFQFWASTQLPGCLGVEEYQMTEAEIDQVLGQKAFSGSSVDNETYDLIEAYQKNLNPPCVLYIAQAQY